MCIYVCVCVCSIVSNSLPDLVNYRLLGFSVYGNFQAGILEGCHFLFQGYLLNRKIEPCLLSLLY